MARRDYYDVLGISKNADEKEIKRAYRALAKKYHPDTNAGNAQSEQLFKEITEAYTILSDPEKRKLYDQFGFAAFDGSMGGDGHYESSNHGGYYNPFGNQQNGTYREYHFEGGNMDDIFEEFFGGGFGQHFRGDFGNDQRQRRGNDLNAEIDISFEEAVFGCDKMIHLQDTSVKSYRVHIPAGIDEGMSVRLRGKGQPGYNGREAGDLLLKVHILEKPGYERKGMDIYTTAAIPFTTAVFGGEAELPTLYGKVICKIPKGTQSGSKIRLRNKGVVSMKDASVKGDEYVTIQIQVPTYLSREEEQKLREYERLTNRAKTGSHTSHVA